VVVCVVVPIAKPAIAQPQQAPTTTTHNTFWTANSGFKPHPVKHFSCHWKSFTFCHTDYLIITWHPPLSHCRLYLILSSSKLAPSHTGHSLWKSDCPALLLVVCCMGMEKPTGNQQVFPRVQVQVQIFWPGKNPYPWLWVWVQVTSWLHSMFGNYLVTQILPWLWPLACTTTSEWAQGSLCSFPTHLTSYQNQMQQLHVIHHHVTTPKGTPVSTIKW